MQDEKRNGNEMQYEIKEARQYRRETSAIRVRGEAIHEAVWRDEGGAARHCA